MLTLIYYILIFYSVNVLLSVPKITYTNNDFEIILNEVFPLTIYYKICFTCFQDTVTPLKKRRLMRESVESILSPVSPTATNSESTSVAISSCSNTEIKTETEQDNLEQLHSLKVEMFSVILPKSKEDTVCKVDALREMSSEIGEKANINEVSKRIKV